MVTAVVNLNIAVDRIPEVAQAIADLDGVGEVYSVAGDVDLIAILRVRDHEDLSDLVAGRINKVPGVLRSHTMIAFRAYSKSSLDAAFALGLEED